MMHGISRKAIYYVACQNELFEKIGRLTHDEIDAH